MGRTIYTDAQREEAARLFRASTLGQEATVAAVAKQTGMSESTVRALAAARGLAKGPTSRRSPLSHEEHGWLFGDDKTESSASTEHSKCKRCPMTRNAGGGHMTTLCAAGNCLLNKREVVE